MAHTFTAKTQSNVQASNPVAHTHTGGPASLAILSIVVEGTTARSGGAPTIDGKTALQVGTTVSSGEHQVEVWYVANVAGVPFLECSIPNTNTRTCHVECVTASAGAGYTSILNNAGTATALNSSDDGVAVNVTSSATGDFLYARLVCGEAATGSVEENSGTPTKVLSYANDHGAYTSFGHYAASDGAGTETFNYVWSNDVGAVVAGAWKSIATPSPSVSAKTTIKDVAIVALALAAFLEVGATDKLTTKDIQTEQLHPLNIHQTEKVTTSDTKTVSRILTIGHTTVGDIPTVEIITPPPPDYYEVNIKDTITTSDGKLFFFPERLVYQTDKLTAKDSKTLTRIAGVGAVQIKDLRTVEVQEAIVDLECVQTDKLTVKDSPTLLEDSVNVSRVDSLTASDVRTLLVDSVNLSKTDSLTTSDTRAYLVEAIKVSKVDSLTISDSKTLLEDAVNVSRVDKLTISDNSIKELSAALNLDVTKIDSLTVSDSRQLLEDHFDVSGIDKLTTKDVSIQQVSDAGVVDVVKRDYLTLSDQSTLLQDHLKVDKTDKLTLRDSSTKSVPGAPGHLTIKDSPTVEVQFANLEVAAVDTVVIKGLKYRSTAKVDSATIKDDKIVSIYDESIKEVYRKDTVTVKSGLPSSKVDRDIWRIVWTTIKDSKTVLIVGTMNPTKVDKLTIKDLPTVQLDHLEVVKSDTVTVSDSNQNKVTDLTIYAKDTVEGKDVRSEQLDHFKVAKVDSLTVGDIDSSRLSHLVVIKQDSLTVKDLKTASWDIKLAVVDTVTAKDQPSEQFDRFVVSKIDSITISDLSTSRTHLAVYQVDRLTSSDIATKQLSHLLVSRVDSSTVGDIKSVKLDHYQVTKQDSLTAKDYPSFYMKNIEISKTETITASDRGIRFAHYLKSLTLGTYLN